MNTINRALIVHRTKLLPADGDFAFAAPQHEPWLHNLRKVSVGRFSLGGNSLALPRVVYLTVAGISGEAASAVYRQAADGWSVDAIVPLFTAQAGLDVERFDVAAALDDKRPASLRNVRCQLQIVDANGRFQPFTDFTELVVEFLVQQYPLQC